MFKYSSASIDVGSEVGVVAIGPITNVLFFAFFALGGMAFYKVWWCGEWCLSWIVLYFTVLEDHYL